MTRHRELDVRDGRSERDKAWFAKLGFRARRCTKPCLDSDWKLLIAGPSDAQSDGVITHRRIEGQLQDRRDPKSRQGCREHGEAQDPYAAAVHVDLAIR